MKRNLKKYIVLLGILFTFLLSNSFSFAVDPLEKVFSDPPEQTKPWCYWYWLSDNISKEGITKDLEAMSRVGIGEAMIGNIFQDNIPAGEVKVLSESWWDMVRHAIAEAERLGIKVGLFNCPGWSQSGGPWVRPEDTMRYVDHVELRVNGPKKIEQKLETPEENYELKRIRKERNDAQNYFQQISVLAFRAPEGDSDGIATRKPKITTEPQIEGAALWFDGDLGTTAPMRARPLKVEVELEESFTARSLSIYPAKDNISSNCDFEYRDEQGNWKPAHAPFRLDRENKAIAVGVFPFSPVVISFPEISAKEFRLTFRDGGGPGEIAEIRISGAARLERYVEKQLGKMHPTPLPMWGTYLWPQPNEPESSKMIVPSEDVLDITKFVDPEGVLRWEVPQGEWIIQRFGMLPTGMENAPASPEGKGFEVDKINSRALAAHFDAYVGELLKSIPAEQRKGFRHVIADSYEMGAENWTDGFAEDFKKVYGYDPIPWLPVFTGRIVASADQSERFLWDLRRLVADRVASEYVGALREIARKNGLRLWLENYGHWGFPGEFLQYGGASEDIGGEFWFAQGDLGNIECRAASSAGHIYGKQVISAEAFTSGFTFKQQPRDFKTRGDWAYTEGINHFVLHVYIHQPWSDKLPGVSAWFGTDFNRNSTWFESSKSWIDYTRRIHGLLQQGNNVADIAYFIGEDVPKMTGEQNPALPVGMGFDYINAEVIVNDLAVKDGVLRLPHGTEYKILVLPELETMRPGVLRKIHQLVKDGAVILGNPPLRSPSMVDYPRCDEEIRKLAAELWGDCDGKSKTGHAFGKGKVFRGISLEEVMKRIELKTDLICPPDIFWTHRKTNSADIYFLSNQKLEKRTESLVFRVEGKVPELWNPVNGEIRKQAAFISDTKKGTVELPITLDSGCSVFVVFREKSDHFSPIVPDSVQPGDQWTRDSKGWVLESSTAGTRNVKTQDGGNFSVEISQTPQECEISGSWEVKFDPKWGGPESITFEKLESWSNRPEPGVKYYSGEGTYLKTFGISDDYVKSDRRLTLDLGEVFGFVCVKLNGKEIATLWNPPYTFDITDAVKVGENSLEISIVNTWWNRLVGDSQSDAKEKYTFATTHIWNEKSELLPAGILGPVKLRPTRIVNVPKP